MSDGINGIQQHLSILVAALWWGCLSGLGFVAVPMLFANLPNVGLAGNMAAKLFTAQSWISFACCALLLVLLRSPIRLPQCERAGITVMLVVVGMLLALWVEYGVAPHIRAREHLRLWHTLGVIMYTGQWLCALATLWRTTSLFQQESLTNQSTPGHLG